MADSSSRSDNTLTSSRSRRNNVSANQTVGTVCSSESSVQSEDTLTKETTVLENKEEEKTVTEQPSENEDTEKTEETPVRSSTGSPPLQSTAQRKTQRPIFSVSPIHGSTSSQSDRHSREPLKTVVEEDGAEQSLTGEGEEKNLLFARLSKESIDEIPKLLAEWLQKNRGDREGAQCELLGMLLRCSGYMQSLSPEEVNIHQSKAIIKKAFKDMLSVNYYTDGGIFEEEEKSEFEQKLPRFIEDLVKRSVIVERDNEVVPFLINLAKGFTSSNSSWFRHTAAYLVGGMMEALLHVIDSVTERMIALNHQLEVVEGKSPGQRSVVRNEQLREHISELEEQVDELQKDVNTLAKQCFQYLIMDVMVPIELTSLNFLKKWMLNYENLVIKEGYLDLLRKMLCHPVHRVRLQVIKIVLVLYLEKTEKTVLQDFYLQNAKILQHMTLDINLQVSKHAIEVATEVYKQWPDIVKSAHIDHINVLVFSKHREVAFAAGDFLRTVLRHQSKDKKIFFIKLAQFYVKTGVESRVGDLVESILDLGSHEIISWRAMTEVLLDSDLQEQYEMSREEVTALVQITGHLVRTACTGYPKIDDGRKKKTSIPKRVKEKMQSIQAQMTLHFIRRLPELVQRFERDKLRAVDLVSIPQYFIMEGNLSPLLNDHVKKLLEVLFAVACSSVHQDVLTQIASTMRTLSEGVAYSSTTKPVCSVLIDELVATMEDRANAFHNTLESYQEVDHDDAFLLNIAVLRVSCFCFHHNLGHYDGLMDRLCKLLELAIIPDDFDFQADEAIIKIPEHCIDAATLLLIWEKKRAVDEKGGEVDKGGEDAESDQVDQDLLPRFEKFSKLLTSLVNKAEAMEVKIKAFQALCELLSIQLGLTERVSEDEAAILVSFLEKHVFTTHLVDSLEQQQLEVRNLKLKQLMGSLCCSIPILPLPVMTCIMENLTTNKEEYSSMIKAAVQNLIKDCSVITFTIMLEILSRQFKNLPLGESLVDSEGFEALKLLASKFAECFPTDKALAYPKLKILKVDFEEQMFIEGVKFAFSMDKSNLAFLEVLAQFSHKLCAMGLKEKATKHFGEKLAEINIQGGMENRHIRYYQASLLRKRISEKMYELYNKELEKIAENNQSSTNDHGVTLHSTLSLTSSRRDDEQSADGREITKKLRTEEEETSRRTTRKSQRLLDQAEKSSSSTSQFSPSRSSLKPPPGTQKHKTVKSPKNVKKISEKKKNSGTSRISVTPVDSSSSVATHNVTRVTHSSSRKSSVPSIDSLKQISVREQPVTSQKRASRSKSCSDADNSDVETPRRKSRRTKSPSGSEDTMPCESSSSASGMETPRRKSKRTKSPSGSEDTIPCESSSGSM